MEYELKTYKRQNMLAPPELKQIHPLGKSPIVSIQAEGMSEPLILAESGLIIEYIIGHFGPQLAPNRYKEGKENQVGGETGEWTRYRYFMHYGEGSLMPYLVVWLVMNSKSPFISICKSKLKNFPTGIKKNSPFFVKPISNAIVANVSSMFLEPNFETNLAFLESQVASSPNGGQYLCGTELTGADIMLSFPLVPVKGHVGFTKEKCPKLWAYTESLEAREAYKKAIQKIIDIEGSYDPSL